MTEPLRPFTLGLVQMAMTADPAENLVRAAGRVADAARQGAQIVCLPEMFRTQYFCQTEDERCFDWAEPAAGPSAETLGRVAREHVVTIVAPIFERRAPGLYHNAALVLGEQGTALDLYRKMHIPDDPGFHEKYYFTPGDRGFRATPTRHGPIGTLICWDQWYPEAARLTALRGAMLLLYPTAIGWLPSEKEALGAAQHDAWRTVQRGHAIANGVYVAAVNRVGHERPAGGEGIEFWGRSFVSDPFGRIVAEAGEGEETVLAVIDPARVEAERRTWPFLRDRRIDAYGGLQARWLDEEETP